MSMIWKEKGATETADLPAKNALFVLTERLSR